MLTEMRLKNFKSWKDTGSMRLAPITGFFGTNSSGKTSLLQALLLLKQSADTSDPNQVLNFGGNKNRDIVHLGSFEDVIHKHELDQPLGFHLRWKQPFMYTNPLPLEGDLSFDAEVIRLEDRTLIGALRRYSDHGKRNYVVGMRAKFAPSLTYWFMQEGSEDQNMRDSMVYGFHGYQLLGDFTGYNRTLIASLENTLQNILYLGPLRAFPERIYQWHGNAPSGVGFSGENFVAALLASRRVEPSHILNDTKVSLEVYVAHWLKELGLIAEFRVEEVAVGSAIYQVKVKRTAESAEVLLPDVGFGVSQLLPVLVLCFYVPEGSTILLEQPEIHLHPAIQSGLADILIDATKKRKVQILLESHSEHLLRRLQRRMAEETLTQEEVSLYFCEQKEGASVATPLDVDEYGNIRNWPSDFFGDQFGEIVKAEKARMKRAKIEVSA